ncbi:MAG: RNA-protein complex protein Nop10 [Nanoarchaeota archaeon]|nr:RNA-protein complex protein Nop10 [Nanoarchaeota archaeon]
MTAEIFFCAACEKYTLKVSCPSCSSKTLSPCPPRYSPLDKWGKWRRLAKKEQNTEKDIKV